MINTEELKIGNLLQIKQKESITKNNWRNILRMKKVTITSLILIIFLAACTCKNFRMERHIVKNKWQKVSGYQYYTGTTFYLSFENGDYQAFSMEEWAKYNINDSITIKKCLVP